TGHGVGLEVHELPSLGISGGLLEAGNVVTVEPGLYYPGIGGVRLEDLAIVGQAGCENITSFERRLVL
ncbi:MAG: M24 family metallopeptidase, partial [Methanothrix sp.]|nr:M24 family metallopeptidase [Methanothrix sp.]